MQRGRLLIIIAFIIIVGAIVVVVVLPRINTRPAQQGATPLPGQTQVPQSNLPTPTPLEFVDIVIAVQELPRGFRIPANALELRPWPEVSAPVNSFTSLEEVIGKIARTDIFREQPILTSMITDDFTSLAEVGSDAAAVLPSGLLAVAVPMDRLSGIAYAIRDGDRVDVILSMLFVDVDDISQTIAPNQITLFQITEDGINFSNTIEGRADSTSLGPGIIGPSERQRPRLVTQRTVQDALVLHVGEFSLDGKLFGKPPTPTPVPAEDSQQSGQQGTPVPSPTPKLPDIVTLGVTPQDAVVLAWAIETRLPLTLALRSAGDASRGTTTGVDMDYMVNTFNINPPVKRQYALEPAIRSIRQLLSTQDSPLTPLDSGG
jgi:Flp pilus assembly protein CpaB